MKKIDMAAWIMWLAMCASTGIFAWSLYQMGMLPVYAMLAAAVILLAVCVWISRMVLPGKNRKGKRRKVGRLVGILMAMVLCAASTTGTYFVETVSRALETMSDGVTSTSVSVYVCSESPILSEEDLQDALVGVIGFETAGNSLVKESLSEAGVTYSEKVYVSPAEMAAHLLSGDVDAIVAKAGYMAMLNEAADTKGISEQVREVYSVTRTAEKKENTKAVAVATQPFNMLISGIDTYGEIGVTSRSDVNMLVSVNPVTREVLLLSIPRDCYVETVAPDPENSANGEMDKLTHTGLYGVEATAATLEKLLGVKINYTMRVNFSSLTNIVDELGGITVYNPNEFTSRVGGFYFPVGDVELDGEKALAFVRERYSFAEGDRERGRNQMRVMNAIIQKALSPQLLKNFSGIMNAIAGSFETDMTPKEMSSLVAGQLNDGGSWNITQMSLGGTGGTDWCYALGNYAYVMYPDEENLEEVKAGLQAVQNGQSPETDEE